MCCFFFFKQKTAYEMRISDWSSDVCSSDLSPRSAHPRAMVSTAGERRRREVGTRQEIPKVEHVGAVSIDVPGGRAQEASPSLGVGARMPNHKRARSEERRVGKECVSPCRDRWCPTH